MFGGDVADDGDRQSPWSHSARVEPQDVGTRDLLDAGRGPLRGTSVRMLFRVEELEDPFHCPCCRVVLVLAEHGQRFGPALFDLPLRERRIPRDVHDDRQDVLEVFREARARDGQRLPVRRHPQRYAAVVELVGQHGGAPRRRAPIQHATRQIREARTFWRIEDAAGVESRADRDRRRHRGFLHKDDGAVGQLLADRRQPLSQRGRHQRDSSGWNEPTVSWFRRRRRWATSRTWSAVTASMHACSLG